jgi:hypothetical protein
MRAIAKRIAKKHYEQTMLFNRERAEGIRYDKDYSSEEDLQQEEDGEEEEAGSALPRVCGDTIYNSYSQKIDRE